MPSAEIATEAKDRIEVVDFYVIQLWPSPPRPDEILRTTSANAAYWHGDVGSRR